MSTSKSLKSLRLLIIMLTLVSITEYTQALPDLRIKTISTIKTDANPGETVQVQYKIENIGDATAKNFTIRLYFSYNSVISTSDVYLNKQRVVASLAAGASSTLYTDNISIPGNAPVGTRYIGCIVDYNKIVTESSESNNTMAKAITINATPDLSVSFLSTNKTSALQGESVQVQYEVHNSGTADANSLKVRLYFSYNSTITTGDTYLSYERTFSSIPSGSTSSRYTANILIPASAPEGTRYIGCIVDYDYQVEESDERNNTKAVSLTVNSAPDLRATLLSLDKASALQGEFVQVQYKIENAGDAVAENFKVRLYLSSNSTISTIDTYLERENIITSLPAGATSDTYTSNIIIPSDFLVGTRYIGCIVDYDYKVTESNENNNKISKSIVINVNNKPDLVVHSLSLDKSSAAPGNIVQVQYAIKNKGPIAANNFKFRLYLSGNSIITTSDTYLNHERTFATLDASTNSSVYTANVRIPSSATGGTYYIGGIVDYDKQIGESIEVNNTKHSAINVCSGFSVLSDIVGDTAACENTSKTYSIEAVSDASSYTWTIPAGWVGSSTTNSITCTNISSAGTIYVVANNICGDVSSEQSLNIQTVVMPNPVVTLESGNLLHSDATEGNQWYKGDNPVAGATSQEYTPVEDGNYYVIVTNDCGTSISNSINYVVSAIESVDNSSSISIYPNPAVNSIQITIKDKQLLSSKVSLINSNGVVVKQIISNNTISTLNISALAKGVYIVRVVSDKAVYTKKLILK